MHLTYETALANARKAYLAGELRAQGPTPACRYRDDSGCGCAIGVSIPDDSPILADHNSQRVGAMPDRLLTSDNLFALSELQDAHDRWCKSLSTAYGPILPMYAAEHEKAFRELINA